MTHFPTVNLPALEVLDMVQKMDAVVALIVEDDVEMDVMVALLDLRDACKKLTDRMDEGPGEEKPWIQITL